MPPPARIDWNAARLHWLGQQPPRSFRETGRAFAVSGRAVSGRAGRERWVDQAAELDRKAADKVETFVVRQRAERIKDTYRLVDKARSKLLAGLDADTTDVRLADIPALLKIEQLLDGEATERIDLGAVRQVFALFIAGSRPLVADERWPEFVAMVEHTALQISAHPTTEGESTP